MDIDTKEVYIPSGSSVNHGGLCYGLLCYAALCSKRKFVHPQGEGNVYVPVP